MRDDPAIAAILGCPTRVAGYVLRPMSVGQYLILHHVGSPVITGVGANYEDLIFALAVCGQSYHDARNLIDADRYSFAKVLRKTARRVKWFGRGDKWLIAFRRYIEKSFQVPEYEIAGGQDGVPIGTNYIVRMMRVVCGEFGFSHYEFLETPLALAWSMFLCAAEESPFGRLRVVSPDLADARDDALGKAREADRRLRSG